MRYHAVGLFCCVLLAGTGHSTTNDPQIFKGKRVKLEEPPRCQLLERDPSHVLDGNLRLSGVSFSMSVKKGRLRVATAPGKEPGTTVRSGKTAAFSWREGKDKRKVTLRFVRDDDDLWSYHNAEALNFSVGGVPFQLIDCDGDGAFGDFERDGYRAYGSNVICPLVPELVLGRNHLVLHALSPNGKELSATLVPLDATPQQLETVERINRLRSVHGLPAVRLDEELSAACTSHARYLELHNWTGLTNPHGQTLGPEGASPEGEAAAKSSVIDKMLPGRSIDGFWRSYYHRIALMGPTLSKVGVNAEPAGIAVVDVVDGYGARAETWPGSEPVFVPADGAVGVATTARGELPSEPVPDLASRGFPLMISFPSYRREVTGFSGRLEEVSGKRYVDVPVLLAEQGDYDWAFGIVPEKPLGRSKSYRATFTYTQDDATVIRTVRFETE